ncbi:MAG: SufS family cysteine desulfurase [Bacteroidales bacterium]|nr:SufS family cysteine desulfurase [Bacteroidales bacterium]
MNFNVEEIRKDFPILNKKIYNKPLVYLDNGATTQKPAVVIDRVHQFYSQFNSSIHRGVHYLSEQATEEYEKARKTVQRFINAKHDYEIIFTSGTTGSINGLAFSFGEKYVHKGDEIIITEMEHHANIVPWQMLCERKEAQLKILPFNNKGDLEIEKLNNLISDKTKLISVTYVSNALGTINPVKDIIDLAHKQNIPVLIDGAQAIQHISIDVQELDCDFFVFSGHKMYGPTGIGILYGKENWLENLPPFQGGGDMVDVVTFEKTTFNALPFKFEAGTTNYIGAIGMAEALHYIENTGIHSINKHEEEILGYATHNLEIIGGITMYGTSEKKSSIISFLINGIHQYDAGMVLDKMGIAVRTGTHCAQPVMQHFNIDGTIRVSIGLYNNKSDVDRLCEGIIKVKEMFS